MTRQPRRTPPRARRRASRALVALVAALLSVMAATPADAAARVGTAACPPDATYTFSNVTESHIMARPYTSGDSGMTLQISLTIGTGVTATATGTVSTGISALIADARVEVSASLALSLTASVSYLGSWTIPTTVAHGYLAVGAASRQMHWTHGRYNGFCQWVVDGHGTLNAPYHLPTFWHWTS